MRLKFTLAAGAMLTLAACGAPDSAETDSPNQAGGPAPEATATATGTPNPTPTPTASATPPAPTASIPMAVRGKWGLVAADCTSRRGDAKGLLTVTDSKVTFYESVGTLADVRERSDSSIRATYDFLGEGMSWVRDMALTASDGGTRLVRKEFGDAPVTLTYTKCD